MLRGISLFVATAFTVTTLISGPVEARAVSEIFVRADGIKAQTELRKDLYAMPSELGSLVSLWEPSAGNTQNGFVVHIQDAHANPEGQENVAAMLKYLESKAPELVVGLEGASGELHPEYLNLFKGYPAANRAVIEDLHKKGELNGAELFLLQKAQKRQETRDQRPVTRGVEGVVQASSLKSPVFGVEDAKLYRDNLQTYRELLSRRDEMQTLLNPIRAQLEKESSRILNGELRDFLKERNRRKEGRFGAQVSEQSDPDFQAYVRYLRQQVLKLLQIDLRDSIEQLRFPNLIRVVGLEEARKGFDAEAAKTQWSEVVLSLRNSAKDAGEKEFVEALASFGREKGFFPEKEGKSFAYPMSKTVYPRKLLEGLFRFARKHQLTFDGKEAFWKTWKLAVFQTEIDVTELMREMDTLEGQMIEKLARTDEEKALVQKLGNFDLLEKLLRLELSRPQYDKVFMDRSLLEDMFLPVPRGLQKSAVIPAQAGIQSGSPIKAVGDDKQKTQLRECFAKAYHFYEVSLKRDETLVANLLAMSARRKPSALPAVSVLYSGGFHTTGVEAILREKGVGYAVFSPRITKTDRGELYDKVMSGENADLSAYFKVRNPFATHQAAIFFKEILEVGAPALFDKFKMPPKEIAETVQRSIESSPVLSKVVSAQPSGDKDTASLQFKTGAVRHSLSVLSDSAVMPPSNLQDVQTSVNIVSGGTASTNPVIVNFGNNALTLDIIQGVPVGGQAMTLDGGARSGKRFASVQQVVKILGGNMSAAENNTQRSGLYAVNRYKGAAAEPVLRSEMRTNEELQKEIGKWEEWRNLARARAQGMLRMNRELFRFFDDLNALKPVKGKEAERLSEEAQTQSEILLGKVREYAVRLKAFAGAIVPASLRALPDGAQLSQEIERLAATGNSNDSGLALKQKSGELQLRINAVQKELQVNSETKKTEVLPELHRKITALYLARLKVQLLQAGAYFLQDKINQNMLKTMVASLYTNYLKLSQEFGWQWLRVLAETATRKVMVVGREGRLRRVYDYESFRFTVGEAEKGEDAPIAIEQDRWVKKENPDGSFLYVPERNPILFESLDDALRGQVHTLVSQEEDYAQILAHISDLDTWLEVLQTYGKILPKDYQLEMRVDLERILTQKPGGLNWGRVEQKAKAAEDIKTALSKLKAGDYEDAAAFLSSAVGNLKSRLTDIRNKEKGVESRTNSLFDKVRLDETSRAAFELVALAIEGRFKEGHQLLELLYDTHYLHIIPSFAQYVSLQEHIVRLKNNFRRLSFAAQPTDFRRSDILARIDQDLDHVRKMTQPKSSVFDSGRIKYTRGGTGGPVRSEVRVTKDQAFNFLMAAADETKQLERQIPQNVPSWFDAAVATLFSVFVLPQDQKTSYEAIRETLRARASNLLDKPALDVPQTEKEWKRFIAHDSAFQFIQPKLVRAGFIASSGHANRGSVSPNRLDVNWKALGISSPLLVLLIGGLIYFLGNLERLQESMAPQPPSRPEMNWLPDLSLPTMPKTESPEWVDPRASWTPSDRVAEFVDSLLGNQDDTELNTPAQKEILALTTNAPALHDSLEFWRGGKRVEVFHSAHNSTRQALAIVELAKKILASPEEAEKWLLVVEDGVLIGEGMKTGDAGLNPDTGAVFAIEEEMTKMGLTNVMVDPWNGFEHISPKVLEKVASDTGNSLEDVKGAAFLRDWIFKLRGAPSLIDQNTAGLFWVEFLRDVGFRGGYSNKEVIDSMTQYLAKLRQSETAMKAGTVFMGDLLNHTVASRLFFGEQNLAAASRDHPQPNVLVLMGDNYSPMFGLPRSSSQEVSTIPIDPSEPKNAGTLFDLFKDFRVLPVPGENQTSPLPSPGRSEARGRGMAGERLLPLALRNADDLTAFLKSYPKQFSRTERVIVLQQLFPHDWNGLWVSSGAIAVVAGVSAAWIRNIRIDAFRKVRYLYDRDVSPGIKNYPPNLSRILNEISYWQDRSKIAVRLRKAFRNGGITNLALLSQKNGWDIMDLNGVGSKGLSSLNDALEVYGLSLKWGRFDKKEVYTAEQAKFSARTETPWQPDMGAVLRHILWGQEKEKKGSFGRLAGALKKAGIKDLEDLRQRADSGSLEFEKIGNESLEAFAAALKAYEIPDINLQNSVGPMVQERKKFRGELIPAGQRYVDYLTFAEEPEEFPEVPDVFLLLGNPSLDSFLEFVKKWKKIKAETGRSIPIVLAGGIGRGTPPLAKRILDHYRRAEEEKLRLDATDEAWLGRAIVKDGTVYESDLMRFVLEREGVAIKGDRTLVRDESKHSTVTVENFTFSAPVVEEVTKGVANPVIAIVTAPYLLRRAKATARKAWLGKPSWVPRAYGTYPVKLNEMTDEALIETMGYVIGYPEAVVTDYQAKNRKLNRFSEYRGLQFQFNPSVLDQESGIPADVPQDLLTAAQAFEKFLETFALRYEPVGERLVPGLEAARSEARVTGLKEVTAMLKEHLGSDNFKSVQRDGESEEEYRNDGLQVRIFKNGFSFKSHRRAGHRSDQDVSFYSKGAGMWNIIEHADDYLVSYSLSAYAEIKLITGARDPHVTTTLTVHGIHGTPVVDIVIDSQDRLRVVVVNRMIEELQRSALFKNASARFKYRNLLIGENDAALDKVKVPEYEKIGNVAYAFASVRGDNMDLILAKDTPIMILKRDGTMIIDAGYLSHDIHHGSLTYQADGASHTITDHDIYSIYVKNTRSWARASLSDNDILKSLARGKEFHLEEEALELFSRVFSLDFVHIVKKNYKEYEWYDVFSRLISLIVSPIWRSYGVSSRVAMVAMARHVVLAMLSGGDPAAMEYLGTFLRRSPDLKEAVLEDPKVQDAFFDLLPKNVVEGSEIVDTPAGITLWLSALSVMVRDASRNRRDEKTERWISKLAHHLKTDSRKFGMTYQFSSLEYIELISGKKPLNSRTVPLAIRRDPQSFNDEELLTRFLKILLESKSHEQGTSSYLTMLAVLDEALQKTGQALPPDILTSLKKAVTEQHPRLIAAIASVMQLTPDAGPLVDSFLSKLRGAAQVTQPGGRSEARMVSGRQISENLSGWSARSRDAEPPRGLPAGRSEMRVVGPPSLRNRQEIPGKSRSKMPVTGTLLPMSVQSGESFIWSGIQVPDRPVARKEADDFIEELTTLYQGGENFSRKLKATKVNALLDWMFPPLEAEIFKTKIKALAAAQRGENVTDVHPLSRLLALLVQKSGEITSEVLTQYDYQSVVLGISDPENNFSRATAAVNELTTLISDYIRILYISDKKIDFDQALRKHARVRESESGKNVQELGVTQELANITIRELESYKREQQANDELLPLLEELLAGNSGVLTRIVELETDVKTAARRLRGLRPSDGNTQAWGAEVDPMQQRISRLTGQLREKLSSPDGLRAMIRRILIEQSAVTNAIKLFDDYKKEFGDADTRSVIVSAKWEMYKKNMDGVAQYPVGQSPRSPLWVFYEELYVRHSGTRFRIYPGLRRGDETFNNWTDTSRTGQTFMQEVMQSLGVFPDKPLQLEAKAGGKYILVVASGSSDTQISDQIAQIEKQKGEVAGIIGEGAFSTHWVILIRSRKNAPPILLMPGTRVLEMMGREGTPAMILPRKDDMCSLILNPSKKDYLEEISRADEHRLRQIALERLRRGIPSPVPINSNVVVGEPAAVSDPVGLGRSDAIPKSMAMNMMSVAEAMKKQSAELQGILASLTGKKRSEARDDATKEPQGAPDAARAILNERVGHYKQLLEQETLSGTDIVLRTFDLQQDSKSKPILDMIEEISAGASPLHKDTERAIMGFDYYQNSDLGTLQLTLELAAMIIAYHQATSGVSLNQRGRLMPLFPMVASYGQFRWIKDVLWPQAKAIAAYEISQSSRKSLKKVTPEIEKIGSDTKFGIMVELVSLLKSGDLERFLNDPHVTRFNIGTNDLWMDHLKEYKLSVNRELPASAEFMNRLYPELDTYLESLIQRAHDKGKKVCFCGGIAEIEKFLLQIEWWRRSLGIKDLQAKDSPVSVSVAGDAIARVNHAMQVFRGIPQEELDWVFGPDSDPAMRDIMAQELSGRYLAVSDTVSLLAERWQEHFAEQGFQYGLYRSDPDPVRGLGGIEDISFMKQLMRAWLTYRPEDLKRLNLSPGNDVSPEEFQRMLDFLADPQATASDYGMINKLKIPLVLEAFDFMQSVATLHQKLQKEKPEKFSGELYPAIMGEFVEAWVAKQLKGVRPDWLPEGDSAVEVFYERYHENQGILFYAARRTLHEIDANLIRPIYTQEKVIRTFKIKDPQTGMEVEKKIKLQLRHGRAMSRERGWKGEMAWYLHVEDALDSFRQHPEMIDEIYLLAARTRVPSTPGVTQNEVYISHRVLQAIEELELERMFPQKAPQRSEAPAQGAPAMAPGFWQSLLSLDRDITYVVWRNQESGRLERASKCFAGLRKRIHKEDGNFSFLMQTLRTLETLERLYGKETGSVYQRASEIFAGVRKDPENVLVTRLAVLLHPVAETEIDQKLFTPARVRSLVKEALRELDIDMRPTSFDKLVWILVQQQRLSRQGFNSSEEIEQPVAAIVNAPGADPEIFKMLYLVSFVRQAADVDPESQRLLPRHGATSFLADLDRFLLAGMSLFASRAKKSGSGAPMLKKALEDANVEVTNSGSERKVLWDNLRGFVESEDRKSIIEDYLEYTQGGTDPELRKILSQTLTDTDRLKDLFEKYSEPASVYYMKTLDTESLLKQLFFFRHLVLLRERGDHDTKPTVFFRIAEQYHQTYEVLMGSAFDEPGLAALCTRTLYENGFFANHAAIRNPLNAPAMVRFLGYFPKRDDMPEVQKKLVAQLAKIFAPIDKLRMPAVEGFIALFKSKLDIRFDRAEEIYGAIHIDKRDAREGAPVEASYDQDQPHAGRTVSVLTVKVPGSDWRGQLLVMLTVLSRFQGLDILNLRFEHPRGVSPVAKIYVTCANGKPLTARMKASYPAQLARYMNMRPITIKGLDVTSQEPPAIFAQNFVINPLTTLHRRPFDEMVGIVQKYGKGVERAMLRMGDHPDVSLQKSGELPSFGIVSGGTSMTIVLEGPNRDKLEELMYALETNVVGKEISGSGGDTKVLLLLRPEAVPVPVPVPLLKEAFSAARVAVQEAAPQAGTAQSSNATFSDEFELVNDKGLHARPASLFAKLAMKAFGNPQMPEADILADVRVTFNGEIVDGKSVMGLMMLAAEPGAKLKIEVAPRPGRSIEFCGAMAREFFAALQNPKIYDDEKKAILRRSNVTPHSGVRAFEPWDERVPFDSKALKFRRELVQKLIKASVENESAKNGIHTVFGKVEWTPSEVTNPNPDTVTMTVVIQDVVAGNVLPERLLGNYKDFFGPDGAFYDFVTLGGFVLGNHDQYQITKSELEAKLGRLVYSVTYSLRSESRMSGKPGYVAGITGLAAHSAVNFVRSEARDENKGQISGEAERPLDKMDTGAVKKIFILGHKGPGTEKLGEDLILFAHFVPLLLRKFPKAQVYVAIDYANMFSSEIYRNRVSPVEDPLYYAGSVPNGNPDVVIEPLDGSFLPVLAPSGSVVEAMSPLGGAGALAGWLAEQRYDLAFDFTPGGVRLKSAYGKLKAPSEPIVFSRMNPLYDNVGFHFTSPLEPPKIEMLTPSGTWLVKGLEELGVPNRNFRAPVFWEIALRIYSLLGLLDKNTDPQDVHSEFSPLPQSDRKWGVDTLVKMLTKAGISEESALKEVFEGSHKFVFINIFAQGNQSLVHRTMWLKLLTQLFFSRTEQGKPADDVYFVFSRGGYKDKLFRPELDRLLTDLRNSFPADKRKFVLDLPGDLSVGRVRAIMRFMDFGVTPDTGTSHLLTVENIPQLEFLPGWSESSRWKTYRENSMVVDSNFMKFLVLYPDKGFRKIVEFMQAQLMLMPIPRRRITIGLPVHIDSEPHFRSEIREAEDLRKVNREIVLKEKVHFKFPPVMQGRLLWRLGDPLKLISRQTWVEVVSAQKPVRRLKIEVDEANKRYILTYSPEDTSIDPLVTYMPMINEAEGLKQSNVLYLQPAFRAFYDEEFGIPLKPGLGRKSKIREHLEMVFAANADLERPIPSNNMDGYIQFWGRLFLPGFYYKHHEQFQAIVDRQTQPRFLLFRERAKPDNFIVYEYYDTYLESSGNGEKIPIDKLDEGRLKKRKGYALRLIEGSEEFRGFHRQINTIEVRREQGASTPGLMGSSVDATGFKFFPLKDVQILSHAGQRRSVSKLANPDMKAIPTIIRRKSDHREIHIRFDDPSNPTAVVIDGIVKESTEDPNQTELVRFKLDGYFNLSVIMRLIEMGQLSGIRASDLVRSTIAAYPELDVSESKRPPVRNYRYDAAKNEISPEGWLNARTFETVTRSEAREADLADSSQSNVDWSLKLHNAILAYFAKVDRSTDSGREKRQRIAKLIQATALSRPQMLRDYLVYDDPEHVIISEVASFLWSFSSMREVMKGLEAEYGLVAGELEAVVTANRSEARAIIQGQGQRTVVTKDNNAKRSEFRDLGLGLDGTQTLPARIGRHNFRRIANLLTGMARISTVQAAGVTANVFYANSVAADLEGGETPENIANARLWIAAQVLQGFRAVKNDGRIDSKAFKQIVAALDRFKVTGASDPAADARGLHVGLPISADLDGLADYAHIFLGFAVALNMKLYLDARVSRDQGLVFQEKFIAAARLKGITVTRSQFRIMGVGAEGDLFQSLHEPGVPQDALLAEEGQLPVDGRATLWTMGPDASQNMKALATDITEALYAALDQRPEKGKVRAIASYNQGLAAAIANAIAGYATIMAAA